jgi:hypothetical protein
MDRKNLAFAAFSLLLMTAISLTGPGLKFHGLQWHLLPTPAGLAYAALLGGQQLSSDLSYLLSQQTASSATVIQVFLSVVASSGGIFYVGSKTEKISLDLT